MIFGKIEAGVLLAKMVHDFATTKRELSTKKVPVKTRRPLRVAIAAAVLGMVSLGALSFSHVVKAVGQDINENVADAKAKKEAERELKAHLKAEKQRLADEKRDQRKADASRAIAEKNAGYDFYENLVGHPWPVPVEREAYGQSATYVAPAAKEDTEALQYSLQAALFRELDEANSTQKSLVKLGYQTKVEDVKVKAGGILYRVTVGPFQGLVKATQVQDALQNQSYYAQVFRE